MLSDGSNTFSWNARNQVATLNSVSLQYDGFGRRTKNLRNTSFLFDGANSVQELSGSTITANLLDGGVDEIFTRADSSGSFTQLKDALGSTIAFVDANGNLVTQYAYDAFGNTILSGAASGNPSQYTGRENEGNGLYFYRARYYSPLLGRFINEDPLGFAGSGPNFYAYVFNSPTNLVDPLGLAAPALVPAVFGGLTLIQGGGGAAAISGTVVETGSVGGPVGVGIAATGAIVYFGGSASNAELNANAAYDEEMQSVIAYNNAILAHPRPSPASLAGRYTGKKRRKWNDDDCETMFASDTQSCNSLPEPSDRAACHAQASERYANCLAGRPIPPLPWRLPN
jgi:RHS repeat-associated protein